MTIRRCLALVSLLALGCGSPPMPPAGLSGHVESESGPVHGATVRFRGRPEHVRTAPDGRFLLPWPTGSRSGLRVTAFQEGFHIAGTDADTRNVALKFRPLPKMDCERYEWVDPTPETGRGEHCGTCHRDAYSEWTASGHAQSVTNRRFRDLFAGTNAHGRPNVGWSLLADNPDGAGVCLSCHAPTASATTFDVREVAGVAGHGVHCDYCHKVTGLGGEIGLTHGRYLLQLLRPDREKGEEQVIFGPLDDADRAENAFSPFQRDSRLCAACHEGIVFGVPVYSTFSEWQESPAGREGRSCQSCHMASTGRTNLAPGHGGVERDAATLANHRMFAGSRAEMLRRVVKLRLSTIREADSVRVSVEITATNVGHRVPTGFIDRNLTLSVQAVDAGNRLIGPPSTHVYAKRLRDEAGRGPVPFWQPGVAVDDNRLRPGVPSVTRHTLPRMAVAVVVRLIHRRFWPEVTAEKGWPDDAVTIIEERVRVNE